MVPLAGPALGRRGRGNDFIWIVQIRTCSEGQGFLAALIEDVAVCFVHVCILGRIQARRLLLHRCLVQFEFKRRRVTRDGLVQVVCLQHLRHLVVALDRAADA